METCKPVE